VKDITSTLQEFSDIAKKALNSSSNDSTFKFYIGQLQALSPEIDSIKQDMENLGVTFDKQGAHYTGNQQALQNLTEAYNKYAAAVNEVGTKVSEKNAIANQKQDIQELSTALTEYYKHKK